MKDDSFSVIKYDSEFPIVLSIRQRNELILKILHERIDTILPSAMQESGLDMWIILCQEDNLDPVFQTLIPIDTWCPILQILIFVKEKNGKIRGINISGTETFDLYERPYTGQVEKEQWKLLKEIVENFDPERIGINIGTVEWAAGGLTHNLYCQLLDNLPQKYHSCLESSEKLIIKWLSTLTNSEIILFKHAARIAHTIIAECYSRKAIMPGFTSSDDLKWYFWQRCVDLGMPISFRPSFSIRRSDSTKKIYGEDDQIIRPGDLIHCDV